MWTREQLFWDARAFYSQLIADLDQAQHNIIFETYIFDYDSIGKRVIRALGNAAARGVNVRVLIDGAGSYESAGTIARILTEAGVALKIFHPIPWDVRAYQWSQTQASSFSRPLHFLGRMNKRNHRKLYVVDGHTAWVGSFNISDSHIGIDNDGRQTLAGWNDLAVRLCGKPVADLCKDFDLIWNRRTQGNLLRRARFFISNQTLALRREKNTQLLELIENAERRIWIANAYFAPTRRLIKALTAASDRGVSVRILVPEKSDIIFFPSISRTYYADLLRANLRIFEYGEKILHAKYWLIDDLAIVGSTNLNYRSIFHDLELDAILQLPETLHEMEHHFIADLNNSTEITRKKLQSYPAISIIMGWLARVLRYWL